VVNIDGKAESLNEPNAAGRVPMITYIFRKRLPTYFSIEKIYDVLYARLESSGADVRRLELPHTSTGIINVLCNAWFVARQRRQGYLHITGDVHYAALLRPFTKTVITIHDCVVLQRGTGFKRLVLWILWFGLPVRMASAITVSNEHVKNEVLKTIGIPEGKISVIPHFVDPAFTFSDHSFATEQPRILHVGTTPNKNLPRVIAALRGIPCVLVIVGPLTAANLRELRESGLRYENFVGIDHAAMTRLYADADMVSFPSTYEGFGMPILEGQAVGRPLLTSDLMPMRGVAGQGGALLVNTQSVESIREGFLALIGDEQFRNLLIAAGKHNCSRFSLDAVAASYVALYRRL
jgi:glycosyltransferase involved in cell wall biosynthesis